jgi:hypothetical protein
MNILTMRLAVDAESSYSLLRPPTSTPIHDLRPRLPNMYAYRLGSCQNRN